jgi:hypothetical protein
MRLQAVAGTPRSWQTVLHLARRRASVADCYREIERLEGQA